jgi:hypothetical protein
MFELRPYQHQNIEILKAALAKYNGALDGSDTGTGKTYTFVGLCRALNARPAIITRKIVIPAWEEACQVMDVDPLFITNYEAAKSPSFPHGRTVIRGQSKTYEWNIDEPRVLFCFDEAQSLRGAATMNSKMALAAAKQFKTVLLSATPFQTPLEAQTIGTILRLFTNNTHWRWMFEHGVRKDYMGHLAFIGDMPDKKKNEPGTNARLGREFMAKLNGTIFPDRGCRTRREDIPGFPETLITCEAIETGEADKITALLLQELEEMRKQDHARACEGVDPDFHELVDVLPVTKDLRNRQEAEMLKCKAIAEMAELEAEKGRAVAIFVNFDASVDLLAKYLDCKFIVRGDGTGKTNNNFNRENVVRAFKENRTPYIIVNVAAGGVGLSLHDCVFQKPRTALISPPYSAVQLRQVLGRVQRLGGGMSTQKILFAAHSIEEKVMRRVQNRLGNLDSLLDADLVVT